MGFNFQVSCFKRIHLIKISEGKSVVLQEKATSTQGRFLIGDIIAVCSVNFNSTFQVRQAFQNSDI